MSDLDIQPIPNPNEKPPSLEFISQMCNRLRSVSSRLMAPEHIDQLETTLSQLIQDDRHRFIAKNLPSNEQTSDTIEGPDQSNITLTTINFRVTLDEHAKNPNPPPRYFQLYVDHDCLENADELLSGIALLQDRQSPQSNDPRSAEAIYHQQTNPLLDKLLQIRQSKTVIMLREVKYDGKSHRNTYTDLGGFIISETGQGLTIFGTGPGTASEQGSKHFPRQILEKSSQDKSFLNDLTDAIRSS